MALFYLLFFCIYYKNNEIVEMIREMANRFTAKPKVLKLLEIIDIHGIYKIRTVGEQINTIVYHFILYQAFTDNLRVVYASIIKQLRFLQLRDSDALHLLVNRDYEMITACIGKYPNKIKLEQFGLPADTGVLCLNYRRYNQAYFEEIVINFKVEPRVALHYRQQFLSTPDDLIVVFEMYCRQDYDKEFIATTKSQITHR